MRLLKRLSVRVVEPWLVCHLLLRTVQSETKSYVDSAHAGVQLVVQGATICFDFSRLTDRFTGSIVSFNPTALTTA